MTELLTNTTQPAADSIMRTPGVADMVFRELGAMAERIDASGVTIMNTAVGEHLPNTTLDLAMGKPEDSNG